VRKFDYLGVVYGSNIVIICQARMGTSDRFFRTHAGLQLGLTLLALNVLLVKITKTSPFSQGPGANPENIYLVLKLQFRAAVQRQQLSLWGGR
jgi:hypothetical protein